MNVIKRFYLISLIIAACNSAIFAQIQPKIEIGSIVSVAYKNSESGNSPLRIDQGNGTFLNKWVLLFGAAINESLSLYAEVQTVNGLNFINYGLSAIYEPEGSRYFNLEIGKFLAPFGTFLGRRWASENPLIDFPLIYEYQTNLSAFDLPNNETELLKVRGQGQRFRYPEESSGAPFAKTAVTHSGHIPKEGSGLRIISREVYLTGFQIFGETNHFHYTFGVTNGALSNPSDINNSSGVQLLGRLRYTPFLGFGIGTSFSWGTFLNKKSINSKLQAIGKSTEDFRQSTAGLDLSYSIGHLVFFSELIFNRWESPFIRENLDALAFYLEGKYTLLTRFYLAGRFSLIDFKDISDPQDVDRDEHFRESWDYDVHQIELGIGYHLNRNALLKFLTQFNRTHEAVEGDPADDLLAFQMVVFF